MSNKYNLKYLTYLLEIQDGWFIFKDWLWKVINMRFPSSL